MAFVSDGDEMGSSQPSDPQRIEGLERDG